MDDQDQRTMLPAGLRQAEKRANKLAKILGTPDLGGSPKLTRHSSSILHRSENKDHVMKSETREPPVRSEIKEPPMKTVIKEPAVRPETKEHLMRSTPQEEPPRSEVTSQSQNSYARPRSTSITKKITREKPLSEEQLNDLALSLSSMPTVRSRKNMEIEDGQLEEKRRSRPLSIRRVNSEGDLRNRASNGSNTSLEFPSIVADRETVQYWMKRTAERFSSPQDATTMGPLEGEIKFIRSLIRVVNYLICEGNVILWGDDESNQKWMNVSLFLIHPFHNTHRCMPNLLSSMKMLFHDGDMLHELLRLLSKDQKNPFFIGISRRPLSWNDLISCPVLYVNTTSGETYRPNNEGKMREMPDDVMMSMEECISMYNNSLTGYTSDPAEEREKTFHYTENLLRGTKERSRKRVHSNRQVVTRQHKYVMVRREVEGWIIQRDPLLIDETDVDERDQFYYLKERLLLLWSNVYRSYRESERYFNMLDGCNDDDIRASIMTNLPIPLKEYLEHLIKTPSWIRLMGDHRSQLEEKTFYLRSMMAQLKEMQDIEDRAEAERLVYKEVSRLILNIKSNINVLSSKKGTDDEFIKILLRSILEHLQLKTNVTTDLCGATTDEIISRLNHLSDDLGRNNSRSDVKDQIHILRMFKSVTDKALFCLGEL
ncbi:hypothetical protein PROFUN_11594 [Planoprotostelium fungivorum]|uniref:Uncharacterized protein n=1 Tax=Planoprotostelium fungivorum TaxID=1890364 RepID=A0A2P6N9T4_9EUKA|nr:hypothetical protein PROFUN_11594 [Planoprotostelium fungivorum]